MTIFPAIDLVIAHETAPGASWPLSRAEFWAPLDPLLQARCAAIGC